MVREFMPDLVLLDMRMPVQDGYQTAAILKADPRLRHIPVVAVTASLLEDDLARLGQGFAGYLRKPLRRADLIRCTMAHLPHRLDGAAPARPEAAAAAGGLTSGLRSALLDAAGLADLAELNRLLEKVGQADPPLADLLRRHLERFDYDGFQACLGAGEESDG